MAAAGFQPALVEPTNMTDTLFQVQVPDASEYWMQMVKCRHACPVHTDACGYVTAIAEGRYETAYRIARATNPFASICGRVCGAPCEANCRRGSLDAPVAIRALKRFVTDTYGPETADYALYREACNRAMLPPNPGDYERIAVVGAGVSGLTVAHDLARLGAAGAESHAIDAAVEPALEQAHEVFAGNAFHGGCFFEGAAELAFQDAVHAAGLLFFT